MSYFWTNDSTYLSATNMNKLVITDGGTLGMMVIGYRIYYDGADWQVDSSTGTITTQATLEAGLNWNATTDELEIDMSGFSGASYNEFYGSYPVVVVSPTAPSGASGTVGNYIPMARSSSATDVHVRFFEVDGTNDELDHVTTESTQMDFHVLMLGVYAVP